MMALFSDYAIFPYCILVFGIGGIVKGVSGVGLPVIAVTLLGFVMGPIEVIALLPLAIIVTNIRQFFGSLYPAEISRKYAVFAIALVVPMFLSSLLILQVPTRLIELLMGISVFLFSVTSLFGFGVKIGAGRFWQVAMGLISGTLGGLTSIWGPTVTLYLVARNVEKDEFIAAIGFMFLVGSIPLIAGLTLSGVITFDVLLLSVVYAAVSLAAMRVGEIVRSRLRGERFRRVVLVVFLLMGLRLIVVGFLPT